MVLLGVPVAAKSNRASRCAKTPFKTPVSLWRAAGERAALPQAPSSPIAGGPTTKCRGRLGIEAAVQSLGV